MADIFLSYAYEDHDVAGRLVRLFECEDWSCWWDQPSIPLGADFRPLVAEAIDEATVVLVLWSQAARQSSWVAWEVERASKTKKLAEFVIGEEPKPTEAKERPSFYGRIRSLLTQPATVEWIAPISADGPLEIPRHPHFGPTRDEVLRRVAETGNLPRRCDGWNSRLHVAGWQNRPPQRPVIGWEWIAPGTDQSRLVRRERWNLGTSVTYGTTIGNAWQFGYEDTVVPIGFIFITEVEHHVQLPKPRRMEDMPFVVPFNVNVRIVEDMGGISYPEGGVDLGLFTKESDTRNG